VARTGHSCAFGYDDRDVVCLFVRVELPDLTGDGCEQLLRGQFSVLRQRIQQTAFAKFLSCMVRRLRCAIGVEHEDVAWAELTFFNRAVPLLKHSQHSGG